MFRLMTLPVMLVLVACSTAQTVLPQATTTLPQPATATPEMSATHEPAVPTQVHATATDAPPAATRLPETVLATPGKTAIPSTAGMSEALPLSAPGPYQRGVRSFELKDTNPNGLQVDITVWYPGIRPEGRSSSFPVRDADPDLSGAPYPLILSSAKSGDIFAPNLASYGFVVVGINHQDPSDNWGPWLIDYPREILFALDWVASHSLDGLEGMIDADRAGAMGYSFDGYNSLALGGARADPKFYLAQCAAAPAMQPPPAAWWIDYICALTGRWDEFILHAGDALTASEDGLWQPMTDERIRAVMPMAPEGAWLFGERGLAAVNRPTLIIGATKDDINFYDLEAVYIFDHLGTPDRTMISFVGQGHMMVFDTEPVARMSHFAAAFFGHHLQNRPDYAIYYAKDFVEQYDDLAWGVYKGP